MFFSPKNPPGFNKHLSSNLRIGQAISNTQALQRNLEASITLILLPNVVRHSWHIMTCIRFAKNEEVQVLVLGQSLVELLQKEKKSQQKAGITEQLRFLKPSMGNLKSKSILQH